MEVNKAKYRFSDTKCSSCSMIGVWRAAGHNDKSVIIFHSPKACAHVTRDLDVSSFYYDLARGCGQRPRGVLLSSNLQDQHSIFGGEEQLLACIEYAAKQYQPEYIMIANSCVAGIIGDDTKKVAEMAEKQVGIPVLTVPCYGFLDKNPYYTGYYYAAYALIDRFMMAKPKNKNKVTLIGDISEITHHELARYLQYFNLEMGGCFPSGMSLDKIKQIPASTFIIMVGGKVGKTEYLWRIANVLATRFSLSVLQETFPVGLANTAKWLVNVGEFLDQPELAVQAIEQEKCYLDAGSTVFRRNLSHNHTAVVIGRSLDFFNPEWLFEIIVYANLRVDSIIILNVVAEKECDQLMAAIKRYTDAPIYLEKDFSAEFTALDFVLTTHELKKISAKQFIIPIFPPYGSNGTLRILQQLSELKQRKNHIGRSICGTF